MRVAPVNSSRCWLRFHAFCASLLKRDWRVGDYPRILVDQRDLNPSIPDGSRWRVDIAGWIGLCGLGVTPEAAEDDLKSNFEIRRDRLEELPRPGIGLTKIEFATDDRVVSDPDLRQKFIFDVLHLPWAWISDESSLIDFTTDPNLDIYYKRIREVFGVDVSDIEGARLADIFERIKFSQQS